MAEDLHFTLLPGQPGEPLRWQCNLCPPVTDLEAHARMHGQATFGADLGVIAGASAQPWSGLWEDPVLVWRNENRPAEPPTPQPPGGLYAITRSEVRISGGAARVHLWWAAIPAEPAARGRRS